MEPASSEQNNVDLEPYMIPKTWKLIGNVKELSDLHCRRIYCQKGKEFDVALYYVHKIFYAINVTCPHQGGPLDQIPDIEALLQMDEPHAVCPWHKYQYSLKTGFSPKGLRAETYDVKIENGNLFVAHQFQLSLTPYKTSKKK